MKDLEASNKVIENEFAEFTSVFMEEVKIEVNSIPSGADVSYDGAFIGRTPVTVYPDKSKPCHLKIKKEGYIAMELIDPLEPLKVKQVGERKVVGLGDVPGLGFLFTAKDVKMVDVLPLYSIVFKLKDKYVKEIPSLPIQINIRRQLKGTDIVVDCNKIENKPVKVSLDLKDVDVMKVLKILSSKAKVNIIASGNVSGQVTLKLKDVPWEKALDIVAKSHGLAYEGQGDSVLVKGSGVTEQPISSDKAKGWLGIKVYPLTDEIKERQQVTAEEGMFVVNVENESPAQESGLVAGDVIQKVNGEAITSVERFAELVSKLSIGDKAEVKIHRKDKELTLYLVAATKLYPTEIDATTQYTSDVQVDLEGTIKTEKKLNKEGAEKTAESIANSTNVKF